MTFFKRFYSTRARFISSRGNTNGSFFNRNTIKAADSHVQRAALDEFLSNSYLIESANDDHRCVVGIIIQSFRGEKNDENKNKTDNINNKALLIPRGGAIRKSSHYVSGKTSMMNRIVFF